jgi:tetratricopeptide (TPR) repeat protein
LLSDAREHLAHATALRPKHARSYAALGYTYDLTAGTAEDALVCFREARRLNPQDAECDVYFLTLLDETGRQNEALVEIEAAAPRHDVNLHALRRALTAAGMPTDATALLLNGFIHARNFFRSSLTAEAGRILNALDPGRARREVAAERKRCAEHQQQLARTFDASRVPEALRALATWARRYGVGDDYCRPFLLRRLSKKQQRALTDEIDGSAREIQAWLDSFSGIAMPSEAAALMHLALGVDEIREQS